MTPEAAARSTATGRAGRGGRRPSPELDDQILDAALATLAEAGYTGLPLNGVPGRAGVAKTTILRRWPSKAAVAAAAVERLALQTVEIPEHGALRADLHALLTNAVHVFTPGPRRPPQPTHHPTPPAPRPPPPRRLLFFFFFFFFFFFVFHPEIADLLLTV